MESKKTRRLGVLSYMSIAYKDLGTTFRYVTLFHVDSYTRRFAYCRFAYNASPTIIANLT